MSMDVINSADIVLTRSACGRPIALTSSKVIHSYLYSISAPPSGIGPVVFYFIYYQCCF